MSKTTIFLSHIHEEVELASRIKQEIEAMFLGVVNVFVSSNRASIKAGQRWLDEISRSLADSKAYFLLCSPASVTRHWIFFEAGAGWVRGIPAIPLCHSGMQKSGLPSPLNLLQAIDLHDLSDLDHVIEVIAGLAGTNKPGTDFPAFISWLRHWEGKYGASIVPHQANKRAQGRPALSTEAHELLREAVLDRSGRIINFQVVGGRILQTNGKRFGSDDARTQARWRGALSELVQMQLIEDMAGNGQAFSVTDRGYQLLENA